MKKIVTMFVMMMALIAVSCAADDGKDSDPAPTVDTVAKQKAITVGNITTFSAGGVSAGGTIDAIGGGDAFKAAFLVGANNAYGAEYDTIEASHISIDPAVADGADFAEGNYTIELTVAITDETPVAFDYTMSVTMTTEIKTADIDYTIALGTTVTGLNNLPEIKIVDGADTTLSVKFNATGGTTGADLAAAVYGAFNKSEVADATLTSVTASDTGALMAGTPVTLAVLLTPTDNADNFETLAAGATKTIDIVVTVAAAITDLTDTELTIMQASLPTGPELETALKAGSVTITTGGDVNGLDDLVAGAELALTVTDVTVPTTAVTFMQKTMTAGIVDTITAKLTAAAVGSKYNVGNFNSQVSGTGNVVLTITADITAKDTSANAIPSGKETFTITLTIDAPTGSTSVAQDAWSAM